MYAAVSFQGTDEPTVIGWMSNWAYARHAPTRPWRSAMTLARTLSLVETSPGPRLRQRPVLPEPRPGVVQFGFTFDGPGEVRLEWSGPEGPTSAALRRLSCEDEATSDDLKGICAWGLLTGGQPVEKGDPLFPRLG